MGGERRGAKRAKTGAGDHIVFWETVSYPYGLGQREHIGRARLGWRTGRSFGVILYPLPNVLPGAEGP